MIKPIVTNSIKFTLLAIVVFYITYILQVNLIIPLFLLSLYLYVKMSYPALNLKKDNLLHLIFLYVIIFVTTYFIISRGWSIFYVPFSVVPMLAVLLFNNLTVSLLLTFASAISIVGIGGNHLYLGLLFLTSGISASILVLNARRRTPIIRAGIVTGLIQAFSWLLINRFQISDLNSYALLFLNGVASSIIVVGVLPVFEYLFKTLTNISLLELADFNNPLLQRLILEAPGTYHHSLVVGNLSEVACSAVGAHALLARVGAYYHDIGKLSKPDYFSENQSISESKHNALSATMSKLVIMNHVKEGVELAKRYKVNPLLTEFISQHHGTSLVYYFYRRALETLEEDQQVKEEGFRYAGPKPSTKESAIVLLADSVEAATRALKDPTPAKIEELVHKVINNKFIDGQLDECDLTLRDLEKISAVFIRILGAVYHARVNYSEGITSENNHKKSSKENPLNGFGPNGDKKSSS